MSGLHDLDFNDWDTSPVIELDMDAIYHAAHQAHAWQLVYECGGIEYRWAGKASSQAAAEFTARAALADRCEGFNRYKARLMAAIGEGS